MVKKVISTSLAACLVFTNFFTGFENIDFGFERSGYVYAEATSDGFEYTIADDVVTITKYTGSATEVTIPAEIDGKPVTTINNQCFNDCSALKSVTFPDSVTTIGYWAFFNCFSLTSITIPSSVTSIGNNAFTNCKNLTSVKILGSIETIESFTFTGCSSLTSVTIPNSVTSIKEWAFNGCSSLTSIEIPNSVTTIEGKAFSGCKGLTSVTIPNSVTSIGDSAFSGCSSLTSIEIPNSVTSIGQLVFNKCSNLKSITIPSSVTTIGRNVFQYSGVEFIYGDKGSAAETYAKANNIKFRRIGEDPIVITFNPNNGSDSIVKELYSDETLDYMPQDPALESHDFLGWFDSQGNKYVEGQSYTANNTYTAKYTKFNIVTFDPANGTDTITKKVYEGDTLDYKEAPAKEGYTFVGWYRDVDDTTTKYENNQLQPEYVTYVAKYAHFEMLGAQAKQIVNDKSGIRFGTKIYNDGDKIVEKGTLILPLDLLRKGQALTLDTPKAAKSVGKYLYERSNKENYVTYLGTLSNVPKAQFNREMTASAYVIYQDKAGNEYTVYSPYKTGSVSILDFFGNSVDWNQEW